MRFLLDQGVPRSAVAELIRRGFEAEHVGERGMATASDEQILECARNLEAVVVTFDCDFHTLLAVNRATTPSTIRIRIEGLKGPDVADLIQQVVESAESDLTHGAAVSVTLNGIRIRLLPLA